MYNGTILLSSVTWAIRAQRLLEGHGMRTNIRKLTKSGSSKGCAYGLDVRGDMQKARRLLNAHGIRYQVD